MSRITKLILIERKLSWMLVLVTLLILFTGYAISRAVISHPLITSMHIHLQWVFAALLALHFFITTFLLRFPWKTFINGLLNRQVKSILFIRFLLILSGWILLLTAAIFMVSGLSWYGFATSKYIPFYYHREVGTYFVIALIVHLAAAIKLVLTRRSVKS